MPEGDTVWLTAHRLNTALTGSPISTFDLRVPDLATVDLRSDTITAVVARGKHLLMRFASGRTLHSHLRMDGSWRLVKASPRAGFGGRDQHLVRALIGTSQWLAIGIRIHDLALIATDAEGDVVGHLGPDVLGPDWDPAAAVDRLAAQPTQAIGEALLDQRNLAGIGNMYKAEILFLTGVNPWTPVGRLTNLDRIVATSYRLLRRNRDHPEQTTTGSLVRGDQHWVYLRAGQPCRRCGTLIEHALQGAPPRARESWWCPSCQPPESPSAAI